MSILFSSKRYPLIVALAIMMIPSGWIMADAPAPDCYVLAAGIDNYPHEGKLSGDLNDARNTTNAFAAQQGKLFRKVYARTLLDAQATHANILKQMQDFTHLGKAGDFFVIFLSGHGGMYNDHKTWYFCPYDESPSNNDGDLTQSQILDSADALMRQGKKVVIIIDACFSGELAVAARPYLNRYQDPKGGGLILFLSSTPSQESNALGQYSAFAKAFADGMAGKADLNHDGTITLTELARYSHNHTYELLKKTNNNQKQDSEMFFSKSISANMPLALLQSRTVTAQTNPPSSRWVGTETRPGIGNFSLQMLSAGRAVMTDMHGNSAGTWQRIGNQITLRFDGNSVVYTGMMNGSILSGSANNGQTSWTWTTRYQ